MEKKIDFEFDVFLSYSSDDKNRVIKIVEFLRGAGLRVWFDDLIKPGDDIYLAIEHGLEASRVLVLCLSAKALASNWVKLERSTVLFRDPSNIERSFIPLLLEDCQLPYTLRRLSYVDFRQETESASLKLLAACGMHNFNISDCPFCDYAKSSKDGDIRLQALFDFIYIFTRADQLTSGAWGSSLACWMNEVGREQENFSLYKEMATEGGIETTAFCAQALAQIWHEHSVLEHDWAKHCRNYFWNRQKDDGSVGYERFALRDHARLIESTCRHTAQAITALLNMGDQSPIPSMAMEYIVKQLQLDGKQSAKTIAEKASQADRLPAMLLSATIKAMRLMRTNPNMLTNHERELYNDATDCEMLAALALIDKNLYPFFKPYAGFESMKWYSFMMTIDLIADQAPGLLGDRIFEGFDQILKFSEKTDGITFWSGSKSGDIGLTACLVSLLISQPILTSAAEKGLDSKLRCWRNNAIKWLVDNFDNYRKNQDLFLYTNSGTLSQLLKIPCCQHMEQDRLQQLDIIILEIKESYHRGEKANNRIAILKKIISGSLVDTSALIALLEEKALDISRYLPS